MWRSLFIALGIMAVIVGIEFLFIDSATIYQGEPANAVSFVDPTGAPANSAKVFRPKDWMPWSLLSGGIITIVYTYLIPVRYARWRQSPGQ
ncbi:putative membrane protein [Rhodopirellula maiorica SM1]|uniref:Putative membrane protein n=1 Tax=Rhodopirellula maiorica SM1 TaxID=1265738 RepID=M5RTN7_9BACT|nr:hypothetical protein [Rhodopirellula maiorica]EMI22571.1 putative membrane protein [Rhodopirellula maiorica SM1]